MVTSEFGCQSELSDEFEFLITGVPGESMHEAIRIYPNPASDKLIVEIETNNPEGIGFNGINLNGVSIDVVSIYGRIIISRHYDMGNRFELGLEAVASGIYLLRIRLSDSIIIRKFQIAR